MPYTYEQELEIFQRQWNMPQYDFKETAETADKLRYANAFLTGDSITIGSANQFIRWVSKTLSIYLETNTQLNAEGKYMSSFDAQEFLNSFENLADAKYRSELVEGQEPNRKPYAGASIEELNIAFNKCVNKINKPLPTLWKDNLKKGVMDMQKLQTITNQAYDNMAKKWYVNENEMAGNLTNVVAAYEAMKQLRESRKGFLGWFWKFFNREQNRQEASYLEQLNEQITQLSGKGYKMEEITRKLTEKTVLGKDVNAQAKAPKTQVKQVSSPQASPKTSTQASPVESRAKSAKMKPVADQIENKFDDIPSEMLVELYRKMTGDQPSVNETQQEKEAREQRELNRTYACKYLLQGMQETITQLNQQFDEAVANGGDPKKEMQNVVNVIFQSTVERFSMNIKDGELEKAEGFKNAAQIIVNNFTAAAIYPNEFADVVNTYIEQNVATYKEIVGAGKDYSKEIENYKKMLEEDVVSAGDEREPVFDGDHPFLETSVNKSEQVSQPPQINAPSMDKK